MLRGCCIISILIADGSIVEEERGFGEMGFSFFFIHKRVRKRYRNREGSCLGRSKVSDRGKWLIYVCSGCYIDLIGISLLV